MAKVLPNGRYPMPLTPTQEKLQFQQGKDIETILKDALESRRAQKHMVARAALDLELTDATVYQWCREFGIDIDDYRCPLTGESSDA